MRKRYKLIYLPDGFMYGIDKEDKPYEDELHICTKYKPFELHSHHARNNEDTCFKIVFTDNPKLRFVPKLPLLEDDEVLAENDFKHMGYESGKTDFKVGFVRGHRSDTKKKYTRKDLNDAIVMALSIGQAHPEGGNRTEDVKKIYEYLDKKPIAVEVEIDYESEYPLSYRGCKLSDEECCCDASESSWCENRRNIKYIETIKLKNNIVQVSRWIYE